MKSDKSTYLIFVLILLVMLAPFSTDMYLPAFPNIADAFHTDFLHIQYTLSLFLIGYTLSQVVFGPLSDRFGRKKMLFIGLAIYILSSLVCATTTNLNLFYLSRIIQALGAGSGAVISFAIIRETFLPEQRIKYIALISAIIGFAPIIAPIIGQFINSILGWRYIYYFFVVIGIVSFMSILYIEESLSNRIKIKLFDLLPTYGSFFKNKGFIFPVLSGGFAFGAMFSFIASSPQVYITTLKLPQHYYAYVFAINACAYMLGNSASAKLQRYLTSKALNLIGSVLMLFGIILLLLIVYMNLLTVPIFVIAFFILTLGVGMLLPGAVAQAMSHITTNIGIASSLITVMQFGLATVASIIIANIHFETVLPLASMVFIASVISFFFAICP